MSLPAAQRWDGALLDILNESDPHHKARKAEKAWAEINRYDTARAALATAPSEPARPSRPSLVDPAQVPRRRLSTGPGRVVLLHALAHIELNAIDLAADMALRFANELDPADRATFVKDWIRVAGEEGLHFRLLSEELAQRGAHYGDMPAHHGLWDAASKTANDVLARLAIAPMILEARGLDVTPGLIAKLEQARDEPAARVLQRIYDDEIGHVRVGVQWFTRLTQDRGLEPEATFRRLVSAHFPAGPKPPFNVWARNQALLPHDWYASLVPQ